MATSDPFVFVPARDAHFAFEGMMAERLGGLTRNWLLSMPKRNPAILEMFATRNAVPHRDLLPWSGEFAGKYLTGGVQILRLTHDPALKAHLADFVAKFVATQAEDGYMGAFPEGDQLGGPRRSWDAWAHYHSMLGLLLWHEETGDAAALQSAIRIGDLFCAKFLNTGKLVADIGEPDKNHAIIHGLCLLYRVTRDEKYLRLARQIVKEFEDPRGCDFVRKALAGKEFYEMPNPRWECLPTLQGLAELYSLTGDADARTTFEWIWWSIVKLDRHNNGGFSSMEKGMGDPYHPGAIETCCTVAWSAMCADMLRLTGNSVVADELELSLLNQTLAYAHPIGCQCTYDTPMDGIRRDSRDDVGFQIKPGSEEINCCTANGPRGFGLVSEWALMRDGAAVVLNWYGPSTMTVPVQGVAVTLEQQTKYPQEGAVALKVSAERDVKFALKLRIPQWSEKTSVTVNGEAIREIQPGTYLVIDRSWGPNDVIQIDFDMSLHYWAGEGRCTGLASAYRGPLLLAEKRAVLFDAVGAKNSPPPIKVTGPAGQETLLHAYCDVEWGTPYASWLRIANVPVTPFTREHPLRTGRPKLIQ